MRVYYVKGVDGRYRTLVAKTDVSDMLERRTLASNESYWIVPGTVSVDD